MLSIIDKWIQVENEYFVEVTKQLLIKYPNFWVRENNCWVFKQNQNIISIDDYSISYKRGKDLICNMSINDEISNLLINKSSGTFIEDDNNKYSNKEILEFIIDNFDLNESFLRALFINLLQLFQSQWELSRDFYCVLKLKFDDYKLKIGDGKISILKNNNLVVSQECPQSLLQKEINNAFSLKRFFPTNNISDGKNDVYVIYFQEYGQDYWNYEYTYVNIPLEINGNHFRYIIIKTDVNNLINYDFDNGDIIEGNVIKFYEKSLTGNIFILE